ncbi:uncharacterized protein N7483_007513 [Penicillium malachiteum]|uniref:uncharacterized protein n=1 Tax=Penicillium malachiteum TaxID=1324776 RepID=UPI00254683D7|nr:uncharacterized protein N7483_007513 [Penicillium malachiteum]KAJ5726156.1 hypothetical protein N7483_007513 [Penicillium malachiteum]
MSHHPSTHRSTLFSLLRITDEAKKVVNHSLNQHLTSRLRDGTLVLDVGRHKSISGGTIATLGRGEDVDIFMEGHNISKYHCSFEIESKTMAIMLYDRSSTQSTYPLGQTSFPFQHGRLRQVVIIHDKFNTKIGIGGENPGIIQFKIVWPDNPENTLRKIKLLHDSINRYDDHPRRT